MEIADAEDLLIERMSSARDSAQIHLGVLDNEPPTSLKGLAAVGLDTNILKTLRHDTVFADQLFLTLRSNKVAVIAPGQSIVEYWNNHKVFAVEEWNKFGADLDRLTKRLDDDNFVGHNPESIGQIRALVAGIAEDLQESKSPEFLTKSTNLIRSLLDVATMPRVSRSRFADLASVRMYSKTPPGFADAKDKFASWGDFFVWCDFLLGVLCAEVSAGRSHYLWITDESKPDWKTGAVGHPFLLEEFQWVCDGALSIFPLPEARRLFNSDKAKDREERAASVAAEDSDLANPPTAIEDTNGADAAGTMN